MADLLAELQQQAAPTDRVDLLAEMQTIQQPAAVPTVAPQAIPSMQPAQPTTPLAEPPVAPFQPQEIEAEQQQRLEALPEITGDIFSLSGSGLLAGQDPLKGAAIIPALLTTTNPRELGQILTTKFPGVIGITETKDGELIATNNETGAKASLNKPDLSQLDILQGLGLVAAFTPAGRAATVPIAAAKAGLTEIGLQAVQGFSGGEFNIPEIAFAAGAGAAGQKLSNIISSKFGKAARPSSQTAEQRAAAQGAEQIPGSSSEAQRKTLAETISKGKIQDIIAEAIPDQKIINAADELNIDILPSASSQNLIFRELEQGLKSIPGSQLNEIEKRGISQLAQRADDLITQFGGTQNKAGLGARIEQAMANTIVAMEKQAGNMYDKLGLNIPPRTAASANNTLDFIKRRIDDLGGSEELSALEKLLLKRLDPETNPTYARLDDLRKRAGAARRGRGEEIFVSAETGLLKKIESLLLSDQRPIAQSFDSGELFDAARTLVAQRKVLEEDVKLIFGQKIQKSLLPQVGRAVVALSKGEMKQFETLMENIPKEFRQEVVLSALNDAFTLGSRKEKQLSIPGFVDWYNGLKRNKTAFNVLVRNMPKDAAQRLDKIATVANGIRRAQESEIKTGRILAVPELFNSLETKLGRIFGIAVKAGAAEIPGSALGFPGVGTATVITNALAKGKTPRSQAADELLASALFKRTLEKNATQGGEIAAEQAEKLIKTKAFKTWLKTISATEARAISDVGFVQWLTAEAPVEQTERTETQQSQ